MSLSICGLGSARTNPATEVIAVPKNLKFLAIPFHELYENASTYGPQLAALPHYLAKYRFECVDEDGNVVAITPGGPPEAGDRTTRDDPRYQNGDANGTNGVKAEDMDTK